MTHGINGSAVPGLEQRHSRRTLWPMLASWPHTPAGGGSSHCTPNGPNGFLCGLERAKVGAPP
eukprot:5624055-Alexandrium_andersonii.AAC.1